jgi:hypothetical protein
MRVIVSLLLFTFISCQTDQAVKNQSANVPTQVPDSMDTVHNEDPLIISERIDGPANIRESVNGKHLFTLNDNVVVAATEAKNSWLQVGLITDLTQQQKDSLIIRKGSKILVEGKEVGQAVDDIHLTGSFESKDGSHAELTGYTAISNIRSNTIVENALYSILNGSPGSLTEKSFERFFKQFQFQNYEGLLPGFKGYEIDENWIDDPSPMLRLWLVFKEKKFYGVFHSRMLQLNGATTTSLNRGFYFSTFSHDQSTNQQLVHAFNAFISHVD